MKCPIDQSVLVMSERKGIEIDYCPTCRGVWLDRGELDKLVSQDQVEVKTTQQNFDGQLYERDEYRGQSGNYHNSGHYKKKKDSFLGELFDF